MYQRLGALCNEVSSSGLMKITYYLDIISSWCYWAEPAWAELKECYAGRVEFSWKLALMDASGLPKSLAQNEWFYRRSGTIVRSPFKINPGWFDPGLSEYLAPNLVAEAARDFGVVGDEVRLALANAALREGCSVGEWGICAAIAAGAVEGVDRAALLTRAQSPEIEARARTATRDFHALGVKQRPTFVLENAIGDKAIFSGLARSAPLIAAMEAMLEDEAAYASYEVHHGVLPAA